MIAEDFSSEPAARNWRTFGDTNLFRWNATNQNLEVTWDSSKTNSFFYKSLGTILAKDDDFTLQFDLRMSDITIGVTSNKPSTFELAVGFLDLSSAMRTNFFRGSGTSPTYGARNLVEFDYFPDSGFGATFAPTVVSSNTVFSYSHNFPLELTPGDLFRIKMDYTGKNKTLKTTVLKNGQPFGMPPNNQMEDVIVTNASDFRVDVFAVESYSDGKEPPPQGSLLAHGVVDNVLITLPPPPVQNLRGRFTGGMWETEFIGRTNWIYTLERTVDLLSWTNVSLPITGLDGTLFLSDTNSTTSLRFYRIKAERP
jgi:hypothetical protein